MQCFLDTKGLLLYDLFYKRITLYSNTVMQQRVLLPPWLSCTTLAVSVVFLWTPKTFQKA